MSGPFQRIRKYIIAQGPETDTFDQICELVQSHPAVLGMTDDDGRTLLHLACCYNNAELARQILPQSLVNSRDENDWTPLLTASSSGFTDIVSLLLSNESIQVNHSNRACATPLHYAASKGHLAIVESLLDHSAFLEALDQNGHTPLMRAVCTNKVEVAEYLIGKNANLEVLENITNSNLMHIAVENRNVSMSSLLYKHAPQLLKLSNTEGKTPVDLATTDILLAWKDILEGSQS